MTTRPSRGRPRILRRSERGSALVEFTMVLPLLMALALGTFTGGTAYFRKISIVDAVREGARYGASLPVPTAGGYASWEASVKSRVAQASGGELESASVCAKLVNANGGSDCGVTDPPGAAAETTVRLVKVSASKNATIEFFFYTKTSALSGKVAARFERDLG
ncbi:MAG TPA: TadE family protein [Acidimicrobiales bacterium]|nr:TadE family protein [Acidimicrobiales bacterium]